MLAGASRKSGSARSSFTFAMLVARRVWARIDDGTSGQLNWLMVMVCEASGHILPRGFRFYLDRRNIVVDLILAVDAAEGHDVERRPLEAQVPGNNEEQGSDRGSCIRWGVHFHKMRSLLLVVIAAFVCIRANGLMANSNFGLSAKLHVSL